MHLLFFLHLQIFLSFFDPQVASGRSISVKLKAPWPTTTLSPILETAEFVSEESNSDFWRFAASLRDDPETTATLDRLEGEPYSEEAHEQMATLAIEIAASQLSLLQQSALRLTLSVRSFAPLVETHRSLSALSSGICGHKISSWVVLMPSRRVLCQPSDLKTLNSSSTSPTVSTLAEISRDEVDHVHATVNNSKAGEDATLYGRLGTSAFYAMHDALVEAQLDGRVNKYVFRHGVPRPGTAVATALQGYGVNLDIKNMEYQNLDDEKNSDSVSDVKGQNFGSNSPGGEAVVFEEGEVVGGIEFSTLHSRKPELGSVLSTFRKLLLDEEESEELKVWKMRDLGLQAAASIVDKDSFKDPLRRLSSLAQDFPVHAKALSSVEVPPSLRSEVESNMMSPVLHQGFLGGGTRASLFVNGRSMDIGLNTFNLFKLLQMLRSETRQLAKLSALRLPTATARSLLELGAAGGSAEGGGEGAQGSDFRIDVVSWSKGAISFVNNLEKDAQYKRWPRSLRQLAFPSWSLHSLSRNLYTLILVVDPTTAAGAEALQTVQGLHQQMYPVRFGVVLTSKSLISDMHEARGVFTPRGLLRAQQEGGGIEQRDSPTERIATAADVAALFSEARLKHSTAVAFSFLFAVASELGPSCEVNDLVSRYADAAATATGAWSRSTFEEEAASALASLQYGATRPSEEESLGVETESALGGMMNMTRFAASKGLPVNSFTVNGLLSPELDLTQGLLQFLGREQHLLGQMVKDGRLGASEPGQGKAKKKGKKKKGEVGGEEEKEAKLPAGKVKSVLSVLMSEPGVVGRYHPLVGETSTDMQFVLPPPQLATTLKYLHPPSTRHSRLKRVSVILVDDWGNPSGLNRLGQALSFLLLGTGPEPDAPPNKKTGSNVDAAAIAAAATTSSSSPSVRLALVLSPDAAPTPQALAFQAVIDAVAGSGAEGRDRSEHGSVLRFLSELATRVRDGADLEPEELALLGTEAGMDSSTVQAAVDAASWGLRRGSSAPAAAGASPFAATTLLGKELAGVDGGGSGGGAVVIANGRCVFVEATEPFLSSDLGLLVEVESQKRALSVEALVEEVEALPQNLDGEQLLECDWRSDAVSIGAAFLGQYTREAREDVDLALRRMHTDHTLLTFNTDAAEQPLLVAPGQQSTSGGGSHGGAGGADIGTVSVTVVLNPLSEAAQRVAPLLLVLRDELKVPLRVLLLPDTAVNEFPLSKFYRYVVGSDVGDVSPGAVFAALPARHVLTMRMDVPEPWNVQSSHAKQDADNLKCDDKACGDGTVGEEDETHTSIEYTLKSLLAAGQCFDLRERRPPNGLQLTLERLGGADSSDTLVMQNLGYFQLQAAPGVWDLSLAEGRGKELYEIEGSSDFFEQADDEGEEVGGRGGGTVEAISVAVTTFYDTNIPLKVHKRKGKESLELLEKQGSEDDEVQVDARGGSTLLSSAYSSMFGGGKRGALSEGSSGGGDDTIHVFSLATGHLYERFLKIMMLSSVKRCSMKIKFWLFENFLSPTFKASAHAMAREFGFELGFVTYKWPSWLRQQTSKQRIIWGYKILFLDVLFPLNVSKVIYVDSDQTVRGDLAELWRMDLKGRPYAYTPFCDSRKETLGYQFWRSGYWKDHLRGRPYHISALYVVDLDRFRRMAVGDQLRALYDNLSRDPNSLANLDQDLPNYAQHMIPIFSLPQEWLWCESWCSDGTKAKAKTIDLCNNPDHKEPKLEMAKRVISGELFPESWVELDDEIRSLEKRQNIGSGTEAAEASLDMGFG